MSTANPASRSQHILGGRPQDERIAFCRNAMTTFERMWGAIRLLSKNHPSRPKFLELFLNAVQCHTEQFGPLAIDVGPYTFSLEGQEILKIDRASENYIYRLFQDGVRQISFAEDLTHEDLERFLEVLFTNFSDRRFRGDNIVTLLWEADLQSISYTAIETFLEIQSEDDDPGTAAQALGVGQDPVSQTQTIAMDDVIAKALAAPVTDRRPFPVPTQRVGLYAKGTTEQNRPLLNQVRERETQALAKLPNPVTNLNLHDRIRHASGADGPKFGEIAFYAVERLGPQAAAPLLEAFSDFALECLLSSQPGKGLIEALSTIDELAQTPEGKKIGSIIFTRLGERDTVDALVGQLTSPRLSEQVKMLLRLLGTVLFPALWERMLEMKETGRQQVLRELLVPYAKPHSRFLLGKLSNSDAEIAAQALYMLQKMDFTPTVKDLIVGLGHASAAVRIEVARTLQLVHDPLANQVLLPHLLNAAEEEVRLAAIRILVSRGGPDLEDHLLAALAEPAFPTRSPEEKMLTVVGLGRVATTNSLPLIRDLASGALPNSAKIEPEIRIAAIRMLGRIGGPEELPLLEKISGKLLASRELKAASRQAIEAIRQRTRAV